MQIDLPAHLEKENKWRKVLKTDFFQVDGINCAFGVSGRLYYTTRIYCSFPLMAEKGSLLYRALKTSAKAKEHWDYTLKQEDDRGIYYEAVTIVKKENFKKSQAALELAEHMKGEMIERKMHIAIENYPPKLRTVVPYSKTPEITFYEMNEAFIRNAADMIELKELGFNQDEEIRKNIKKIYAREKGIGWSVLKMTACLEIVPFSYCGNSPTFFLVNCTRFYIHMMVSRGNHSEFYTSRDVDFRTFCFVQAPDGKIKRFCDTYAGSEFLAKFAGKHWEALKLDSKTFFRALTTQTTFKVSQKGRIENYLAPGSIIRVSDKQIGVYLENDQLVEIIAKKDNSNDKRIFNYTSVDTFIGNCKEFKQITLIVERFDIEEIRQRANLINQSNDCADLSKNTYDEIAFYLTAGVTASVQGGFFERVFTKRPGITVNIDGKSNPYTYI